MPQNYQEAFNWFRRAADQGNYLAQSRFSLMYRDGMGVPQDYTRAYLWANLAAQSNEPADEPGHYTPAQTAMEERDFIAKVKMSPTQLAEAQRLASNWNPEPITEPLPKPEQAPQVRSYQTRLFASRTEEWVAEGDRRTAIVWNDEKSMNVGYEMIAAGPGNADPDDLFRLTACMVLPGTRVMVGTPGEHSSYVTVIEGPSKACSGRVLNARLSDAAPVESENDQSLQSRQKMAQLELPYTADEFVEAFNSELASNLKLRKDFCHTLQNGTEECVYKDQLIMLSLISSSPGTKIKTAAIIAGVANDSTPSVLNATTSCVMFVKLISPELRENAINDLLSNMLKAAIQNKTNGKNGDVIEQIGGLITE